MSENEKKIKARENAKKYYQKHREKILARQKEYVRKRYQTDEEFRKRTLENHKRYENNNLERVKKIKRDAQKKYYQQHIDYYRNYSKQWSKEKHDSLKKEIERLNNIINEVYEYLDKKKDVPEWWDTDFMICMDKLKGGTGNLKDILGSDK